MPFFFIFVELPFTGHLANSIRSCYVCCILYAYMVHNQLVYNNLPREAVTSKSPAITSSVQGKLIDVATVEINTKYQCKFQKGKSTTYHLVMLEVYIRQGFVKNQHIVEVRWNNTYFSLNSQEERVPQVSILSPNLFTVSASTCDKQCFKRSCAYM